MERELKKGLCEEIPGTGIQAVSLDAPRQGQAPRPKVHWGTGN